MRSLHIERGLPDPLSSSCCAASNVPRPPAAPPSPPAFPSPGPRFSPSGAARTCQHPTTTCSGRPPAQPGSAFFASASSLVPHLVSIPLPIFLHVHDLAVDDHQLPSAVLVRIKASKTDPFRKGVQLLLPRTGGPLCPVDALSSYLSIRGNAPGPLFRFASGVPLSRPHVTNWLRSTLAAAGVQGNYSSHIYRIGAATTAHAAGVPDSLIRTLGRWSSDAYLVYIQTSHDTLRSAAALLASDPGSDPLSPYPSSSVPLEPQGFPLFPGPAFPAWRPPFLFGSAVGGGYLATVQAFWASLRPRPLCTTGQTTVPQANRTLNDVKMLTKVSGLERVVLGAAAPAASILPALSCSRGRFSACRIFALPASPSVVSTVAPRYWHCSSCFLYYSPLPLPCSPISHLHWSAPVWHGAKAPFIGGGYLATVQAFWASLRPRPPLHHRPNNGTASESDINAEYICGTDSSSWRYWCEVGRREGLSFRGVYLWHGLLVGEGLVRSREARSAE